MKTVEEIKAEIIRMMTILRNAKKNPLEKEYAAIYSHQLLILNSLFKFIEGKENEPEA